MPSSGASLLRTSALPSHLGTQIQRAKTLCLDGASGDSHHSPLALLIRFFLCSGLVLIPHLNKQMEYFPAALTTSDEHTLPSISRALEMTLCVCTSDQMPVPRAKERCNGVRGRGACRPPTDTAWLE